MPNKKEMDALVCIASRLDAKEVKSAQVKARKLIRIAARQARIDSDGTRRGVTLSYRSEMERLRNEKRETAAGFKHALKQSDIDIAAGFTAKREEQASRNVLATHIAVTDAQAGQVSA